MVFLTTIFGGISSFFTSILSNIQTYLIIFGVIIALVLVGFVWYKLSSDESTIAALTENNKTLQTSVATLQTTTQALQTDIVNVQTATAQANASIQSIQSASQKQAQVIQSTNYNAEATTDSKTLTTQINTDTASIFNKIEKDSVIPNVVSGASK